MVKKTILIILLTAWIASNAFASENNNEPGTSSASGFNNQTAGPDSPPLVLDKQSGKLMMTQQAATDDLSHTSPSSDLNKKKDTFYFIDAGAAIPIYDKTFTDFIDYGASINIGAGKKITSNLTLTASIGVVMMTGKWSVKGDRHSIEIAAESWTPGIISEPGQVVIYPEDVPPVNLGEGYHASGEAVVTSAENLESVDVDTTLYLFPIKLNALYQFQDIGKIKPYAGGGFGFCLADRKVDSKALKTKYFDGPEYGIKIEKSQSVTGMLFDLVFGFVVPFKNDMKIVGEVNTTFYDLDNFDPILEVSYQKTSPSPYTSSDITTFSYEDPQKIGVFKNVFITTLSIGLIIPF